MSATKVSCPACAQKLSVAPEALRARMQCPRCGNGFVPADVMPRSNTLPAIPDVRPSGGPHAASASPSIPRPPRPPTLTGKAGTVIMQGTAGRTSATPAAALPPPPPLPPTAAAAAPAPTATPSSAAAPAPASDFEMPQRAKHAQMPPRPGALPPAPTVIDALLAGPGPRSERRPDVAPRSERGTSRGRPSEQPTSSHTRRPTRRSSIMMLKETGRATTIEIAQLATDFEQHTTARLSRLSKRRHIGYSQIALVAAPATGLGLIVLALADATVVRVVAGVVAALSLAVLIAAAVAYGLVRWRSENEPRSERYVAPEVLAAYSAIAARPSVGTVSKVARVALAASAFFVMLVAVASTWVFAEATHLSRHRHEGPPPSISLMAEQQPPKVPRGERADVRVRREGHVFVSGGVLHVPESFSSADGTFDLVMHFHGNTQIVEESYNAAKINALIYVVNLGIGSGAYEDRYSAPDVFEETLTRIVDAAEKRGLRSPKLGRIALSSWSAGYGAIAKILDAQRSFDRFDALLMLDGIHSAYLDPKNRRNPDLLRLRPFLRFASEAAEGRKLFTITHSEIEPREYASAGETANELLRAVGAQRLEVQGAPPKVTLPATIGVWSREAERWLRQTTEARLGGLHVRGYVGHTAEHHMAHLVQMSVTVLPELAERWD